MPRWPQIKAGTSRQVHGTFSWPAVYRRASGGASINVSVRLHLRNKMLGDLDREGYATVVEDVAYIVMDTIEVADPKRGDRAYFPDIDKTFELQVADPFDDGGAFQRWEIREVANA